VARVGHSFAIEKWERDYLRDLARKQLEYANLPVMAERTKLWYDHNHLRGDRPVIVMEMETFEDDMLPPAKCQTPAAIRIEREILRWTVNHELIDDDKVVPAYYSVSWQIHFRELNIDIHSTHALDSKGRSIGYATDYVIKDLPQDLAKLGRSVYSVDREGTMAWKSFVEDVIGDILPVRITNDTLRWSLSPSIRVVRLMGLENMMYAMIDCPDALHSLYRLLVDDAMEYVHWQEAEGLLVLNNGNDYAGAGSYGFTDELPTEQCRETGVVRPADLWLNLNSQETVGVSPSMYGEFIYPYYEELASQFGLVYYGCCEPVHDIWSDYLSRLPHLRKVSVSAWCNEAFMGEALKGSNVIYSRKPRPNYIGVGQFDESAFAEHIAETLTHAAGCHLEFIFRDIYALDGDRTKPGRAVKIVRELIERNWQP
jgi:hypothetical protein